MYKNKSHNNLSVVLEVASMIIQNYYNFSLEMNVNINFEVFLPFFIIPLNFGGKCYYATVFIQ